METDQDGTLWVGTEAGASRWTPNGFEAIKETAGQTITAIISPEPRRVLISTEQGQIFDSRVMIVNVTKVAAASPIVQ